MTTPAESAERLRAEFRFHSSVTARDICILADAYLAEHQADDGEYAAKMEELVHGDGDKEADHMQADAILLELIRSFGYSKTAAAFGRVRKWYS